MATIDERQTATKPKPLTGADVLVASLVRHGVEVIFAYPGGASMPMHQALTRIRDKIRTILPRHERGGSSRPRATPAPAARSGWSWPPPAPALNLVTGLADAKMDSLPVVAITGQVPSHVIGTDAFQETPMVEVSRAITKHHTLVRSAKDIAPGRQGGLPHRQHRASRPGPDRRPQGHPEHARPQSRLRRGDGPARLPFAAAPAAREARGRAGRDPGEPEADHLLRRWRHRFECRRGAPRVRS